MATSTDILTLSQWFGANFPVGSFAYSHGLEAMCEAGKVSDAKTFSPWLFDVLQRGAGRQDAILLALAYRGDASEVAELAIALGSSRERHLETTAQGRAFSNVVSDVWDGPKEAWPLPVIAGAAAKAERLPLAETLTFYLQAFAGNLCTIAARCVPIGQTEAQRVLRSAAPVIEAIAAEAMTASEDDLGSAVMAADIAAIAHETQTTRIYRT
ncbi:urease accessory protein UreF [Marivivens aquimaris]|uniref:urease accessory protein UreF n=1 Tax=Marivivens aquimaris TaxID=2774876 RepID=UPI001882FD0E|nr:urease accessory UreF family protein [Marivivens aquimaris]